ncbi:PspA/IM30 family protein [Nocardia sp.]|uniref:PspA/IM30 family protein n=1 Tax=Nocardia sp. TaxID=1821 RepID=UPI002616F1DD|nr:hypothetical protein [Nocardia sp.]
MSNAEDLVSELAKLPDAELAAAVAQVTAGRAGLSALHEVAAAVAATVGHAPDYIDVTPDTDPAPGSPPLDVAVTLDQVEGGPLVTGLPVPPAGIPTAPGIGGYTTAGVPTFESVRDKVEQRYGTAQGMDELDRQTPAGRSVEEQWDARQKTARERLEQIRKSMHGNDND